MRNQTIILSIAGALLGVIVAPDCIFAQPLKPKRIGEGLSPRTEQALAQITKINGEADLVLAGDKTKLQAHDGDLIFKGDLLVTAAGSATFVFCPPGATSVERTLQASSRVEFQPAGAVARTGAMSASHTAAFCRLPVVTRYPVTGAKESGAAKPPGTVKPIDSTRWSRADASELALIDAALRKNPNDVSARTTRALLLIRNKLIEEATDEYALIAAARTDLPWAKELVHETPKAETMPATCPNCPAYAVVIGISHYGRSAITDLNFADRDAESFYNYLRSDRGGNIPKDNIVLLTNEKAKKDAIKRYIEQFQAKPRSKLIVFLSGHGAVSNGQGYLITYGSDPNNLKDSAYPMEALNQMLYGGTAGRVELFVDACRSGHIGPIKEKNAINQYMLPRAGPVFGMLASQRDEIAWEYDGLGKGHGAFTYFLLRALNSDREYTDGKLTIYDFTEYVRRNVRLLTRSRQTPQNQTTVNENEVFALKAKAGIPVEFWDGKPMPPSKLVAPKGLKLFEVEPPESPPPGLSRDAKLEELIKYENQGQAVLERYLKGDEIRQEKTDFQRGLDAYTAALGISDTTDIESRVKFFEGRIAIEDHNWRKARLALELAIRLDPGSPAAYNALGIAYLEQAEYENAIAAFLDAIRRAPYWPYPRHNLALAYAQQGNYELAIDTYNKAIAAAPNHSYLPYNLGLLLEKINRPEEAEQFYLIARDVARNRAEQAEEEVSKQPGDAAYLAEANRLGSLRVLPCMALSLVSANLGKRKQAQSYYEEAMSLLKKYPDTKQLAMLRHNYAQSLYTRKDGLVEARRLWRMNVDEANYIPSRISIADDLRSRKPAPDLTGAIEQYQAAVLAEPDNVSQRLRLADLLETRGDARQALVQVSEASRQAPASVLILERLGDLDALVNQAPQARSAYEKAIELSSDPKVRKRLAEKAAKLP